MNDVLQGITKVSDLCEWLELSESEVLDGLKLAGVQVGCIIGVLTVDESHLRELNRQSRAVPPREDVSPRGENAAGARRKAKTEPKHPAIDSPAKSPPLGERPEVGEERLVSVFDCTEVDAILSGLPLECHEREFKKKPVASVNEFVEFSVMEDSDPHRRVREMCESGEIHSIKSEQGTWMLDPKSCILRNHGVKDPRT